TRSKRDWSSDVCSSDLRPHRLAVTAATESVKPQKRIALRPIRTTSDRHTVLRGARHMPRFLTKAPDFSLTRLSLPASFPTGIPRSEEHTSELQSRFDLL